MPLYCYEYYVVSRCCWNVFSQSSAVRPDRMRGGRNKFGPLYRRDRQMKRQKANTAPYRTERETTQTHCPISPKDPLLLGCHSTEPSSSDAFNVTYMYPSSMGQTGEPTPLDCSHRVLTPPSLPYPGTYCSLSGLPKEKGDFFLSYSSPSSQYSEILTPKTATTSSQSPESSPCSTPNSAGASFQVFSKTPTTPLSPHSHSFLNQLMEGEQDESLLCTKVLATLQREQANRGKHDRLNTFSIMCKIADQTLFGLVEWARNTDLFKELKVGNLNSDTCCNL